MVPLLLHLAFPPVHSVSDEGGALRYDHVQSWWDRPLLVAVALISSHGTGWGLVESPTSPERG